MVPDAGLRLYRGAGNDRALMFCLPPSSYLKVLACARVGNEPRGNTAYGERFGIPSPVKKEITLQRLHLLGRSIEAGSLEDPLDGTAGRNLFNDVLIATSPNEPEQVKLASSKVFNLSLMAQRQLPST